MKHDSYAGWPRIAGGLLLVLILPLGNGPRLLAADSAAIAAAILSIRADDLMRHAETLGDDRFEGREAGSRGGLASGGYLTSELQRMGLEPAGVNGWFQTFLAGYRNVLAVLPGSDPNLAREYVLVGAHYDHVGYGSPRNSYGPFGYIHNGADDNASGTSTLLELAEAFATLPQAPKRSILFAFWDGEEKGLLGSKNWVANPTFPLTQLKTVVNLDMVGRLRESRLEVAGTRTGAGLRRMTCLAAQGSELTLDFNWQFKPNSDHWTFYEKRIPVLMFHTGLHADYHRPSDDVEKLNSGGMEEIGRIIFPLVLQLAEAPELAGFRPDAMRETNLDRRRLETPTPALPPRLGITWDDAAKTNEAPGLVVASVVIGSPADQVGLRAGDRLLKLDGKPLERGQELRTQVLAAKSVALTYQRTGAAEPADVTVPLAGQPIRVGLSWRVDPAEPGIMLVTRVVPGSAADVGELRVGDRIYRARGSDLADSNAFEQVLLQASGPLELLVERGGRLSTVHLEISPPLAETTD